MQPLDLVARNQLGFVTALVLAVASVAEKACNGSKTLWREECCTKALVRRVLGAASVTISLFLISPALLFKRQKHLKLCILVRNMIIFLFPSITDGEENSKCEIVLRGVLSGPKAENSQLSVYWPLHRWHTLLQSCGSHLKMLQKIKLKIETTVKEKNQVTALQLFYTSTVFSDLKMSFKCERCIKSSESRYFMPGFCRWVSRKLKFNCTLL